MNFLPNLTKWKSQDTWNPSHGTWSNVLWISCQWLSEKPKAIISAMGPTSFFLLSPIDPIFFSKKMDDAETHFGAVDYTLWGGGVSCTSWACNRNQQDPKCRMGSTKMCQCASKHILNGQMGSKGKKSQGNCGFNLFHQKLPRQYDIKAPVVVQSSRHVLWISCECYELKSVLRISCECDELKSL